MQDIQAPKRQFHFTPEELKSFQKMGTRPLHNL